MDLEQKIWDNVHVAISKAILDSMANYNSPLKKLSERVINNNSDLLLSIMDESVHSLLESDDFVIELKIAIKQKLAKTLISKMGGEIEKRVNELRQNPQTRARITNGIMNVIESIL